MATLQPITGFLPQKNSQNYSWDTHGSSKQVIKEVRIIKPKGYILILGAELKSKILEGENRCSDNAVFVANLQLSSAIIQPLDQHFLCKVTIWFPRVLLATMHLFKNILRL